MHRKNKSIAICMLITVACYFMIKVFQDEERFLVKTSQLLILSQPSKQNMCDAKRNQNAIIVVYTAPGHFKQRNLIRQTYGSHKVKNFTGISVYFFIGLTNDENLIKKILEESSKYDDIIRHYYPDSYYTLTMKTIAFMQWVQNNCQQKIKYIYKIDDDILLDVFAFKKFLEVKKPGFDNEKKIMCREYKNATVNRKQSSKFYVPKKLLQEKAYPDYCDGRSVIFTRSCIEPLLKAYASSKMDMKNAYIEDVITTGYFRSKVGIVIENVENLSDILEMNKKILKADINAFDIGNNKNMWLKTWKKIYAFHHKL